MPLGHLRVSLVSSALGDTAVRQARATLERRLLEAATLSSTRALFNASQEAAIEQSN
jgi:hypothetical protein